MGRNLNWRRSVSHKAQIRGVQKTPFFAAPQAVDSVRAAEGVFDVQEGYVFGGTR